MDAVRLRRPGRSSWSLLGLIALIVAAAGVLMIVVRGFVRQLPEISAQLLLGWESLLAWARGLNIDAVWLERARAAAQDSVPAISQGILRAVSSTFSGVPSIGIGTFFAIFFLFFVLRDPRAFPQWQTRVTRMSRCWVDAVVMAVKDSIRGYFRGIAMTALITAPIVAAAKRAAEALKGIRRQ